MLRKVLLVVVAIFPVLVSLASWNTVDDREKDSFDITHDEVGETLDYPVNAALDDGDVAYALITESAQAAGVNVISKANHRAKDGTYSLDYFVYLTSNDSYLNTIFSLKSGRFLSTNDQDPEDAYLSTRSPSDLDQIGVIQEFGGNDLVNLFIFRKYFSLYKVSGHYFIECTRSEDCELFFETLSLKINRLGVYMEPEFLRAHYGNVGIIVSIEIPPQVLIYLMLFLVLVLIIFCIFNEYKTIGILRLHGRNNSTIIIGKFVTPFTIVFLSSSVVISLIWLVFGKTTDEFWFEFFYQLFILFGLVLITCLLALPFMYLLNIPTAVKGQKGTAPIIIVNAVSKLIISILLMILTTNCVGLWTNFLKEEALLKEVAQWTDFGLFYPSSIGTTISDLLGDDEELKIQVLQLYPYLESEGALYVDSQSLVSSEQLYDFSFDSGKSITVNPNYLQRYPAYDASGSRIYVDDTETSWVVIVPIGYQAQEDLIRSTYQRRRSAVLLDAHYFESEDQERLKTQPVKIIWTANNQNYFTFNPRVDYVTDPLIQVMTQSNSIGDDRLNAFGLGIDSALKVYLGNNSTDSVLATFEPTLSRLNLDDNFVSLLSFSEYSEYVMNDHNFYLENWGIRIGILFFVMMLLIVQSAAINYERESRRIAVFKIQGYKFLDRYINPILNFALTWFVIAGALTIIYISPPIDFQIGISRSMDRLFPVVSEYNQFLFVDPMLIFAIVGIFVLLDMVITAISFKLIESKRVVTTLKGET